jgi:hypothetical protein
VTFGASRSLARSAALLLVVATASCTGGVSVDYPLFPRQTCPSCWDDLYQGSDPPRPR